MLKKGENTTFPKIVKKGGKHAFKKKSYYINPKNEGFRKISLFFQTFHKVLELFYIDSKPFVTTNYYRAMNYL